MVVSWNPPLDDGGCAISNYIVEKRDSNRDLWMPVSESCTRTQCRVPKLIEGRDYIIRICAQNINGISDPLLSAETKARDVFSKCALVILLTPPNLCFLLFHSDVKTAILFPKQRYLTLPSSQW